MKYLETSFCKEPWPRSGKCGKFFFHHTKAFSDPFRIIYTFALMSVRNSRWKRLLYWGSAVAEAYREFSGRLMLEISWRLWNWTNLLLLSLIVCLLGYILDICTEICTSSVTSEVLSMIINNKLRQQPGSAYVFLTYMLLTELYRL